jgi:hypothetical protein
MSYSFNVRAHNKRVAMDKVASAMMQVVATQPVHASDAEQAKAAASAFIDILPAVPDDRDIIVSVNGSLGWAGQLGEHSFTSAAVSVSAYLTAKEVPKA